MTSQQPQAGFYSPDGLYRWDGTAWQPVQPPSPQLAAVQTWGAPAPHAPQPRRRTPAAALVGLVAAAALVVGAVGGLAAGQARSSASFSPAAVPAVPAEFPNASRRYLQGVTVSQITQAWQEQDGAGTCAPTGQGGRSTNSEQQLQCGTGAGDATFFIEFDDEALIRDVRAECSPGAVSQRCTTVFAFTAAAALTGEPDLQQQARDWAAENAGGESSTVIGGVYLSTSVGLRNFLDCRSAA